MGVQWNACPQVKDVDTAIYNQGYPICLSCSEKTTATMTTTTTPATTPVTTATTTPTTTPAPTTKLTTTANKCGYAILDTMQSRMGRRWREGVQSRRNPVGHRI